jgi:hypothetical protein
MEERSAASSSHQCIDVQGKEPLIKSDTDMSYSEHWDSVHLTEFRKEDARICDNTMLSLGTHT